MSAYDLREWAEPVVGETALSASAGAIRREIEVPLLPSDGR
jgi:hypothetical protein